MSEFITVARPYAKAVFDFAVEHQCVDHWQNMLTFAAKVSCTEQVSGFLSSALSPNKLSESFVAICGDMLDEHGKNLIKIMAESGRLITLPEVLNQFVQLRTSQEKVVDIDVTSANELNNEQLAKIATAMEQRLSRKVKLNCNIDKSVIAGVIIRAGDMVMDGSIRGRLDRLADALQS